MVLTSARTPTLYTRTHSPWFSALIFITLLHINVAGEIVRVSTLNSDPTPPHSLSADIVLSFASHEQDFRLILERHDDFISPSFRAGSQSRKLLSQCFYRGSDAHSPGDSYVAVSLCGSHEHPATATAAATGTAATPSDGSRVQGFFHARGESYWIEPAHVPNELRGLLEDEAIRPNEFHRVSRLGDSSPELEQFVAAGIGSGDGNSPRARADPKPNSRGTSSPSSSQSRSNARGASGVPPHSKSLLQQSPATAKYLDVLVVIDESFTSMPRTSSPELAALEVLHLVAAIFRVNRFPAPLQVVVADIHQVDDSRATFGDQSVNGTSQVNASSLWEAFSGWCSTTAPELADHHTAQLLTGSEFAGDTYAFSSIGSVCSNLSTAAAGVNSVTRSLFENALTVAHSIGHTLGMRHDGDENPCGDFRGVMSPRTTSTDTTTTPSSLFSPCSIAQVGELFSGGDETTSESASASCLRQDAADAETVFAPRCGNGVVERGEECDCGRRRCDAPDFSETATSNFGSGETAADPCCDGSICRFKPGAVCPEWMPCCEQCAIVPLESQTVCRGQETGCELGETICDGHVAECPPSVFAAAGESCAVTESDSVLRDGMCYDGACHAAPRSGDGEEGFCSVDTLTECCAGVVDGTPCGRFDGAEYLCRAGVCEDAESLIEYVWHALPWETCPKACLASSSDAVAQQEREIVCRRIDAVAVVDDALCDDALKPPGARDCNPFVCGACDGISCGDHGLCYPTLYPENVSNGGDDEGSDFFCRCFDGYGGSQCSDAPAIIFPLAGQPPRMVNRGEVIEIAWHNAGNIDEVVVVLTPQGTDFPVSTYLTQPPLALPIADDVTTFRWVVDLSLEVGRNYRIETIFSNAIFDRTSVFEVGCQNSTCAPGWCNADTATCECPPGIVGATCDTNVCSEVLRCQDREHATGCDPTGNKCICEEHWAGELCTYAADDQSGYPRCTVGQNKCLNGGFLSSCVGDDYRCVCRRGDVDDAAASFIDKLYPRGYTSEAFASPPVPDTVARDLEEFPRTSGHWQGAMCGDCGLECVDGTPDDECTRCECSSKRVVGARCDMHFNEFSMPLQITRSNIDMTETAAFLSAFEADLGFALQLPAARIEAECIEVDRQDDRRVGLVDESAFVREHPLEPYCRSKDTLRLADHAASAATGRAAYSAAAAVREGAAAVPAAATAAAAAGTVELLQEDGEEMAFIAEGVRVTFRVLYPIGQSAGAYYNELQRQIFDVNQSSALWRGVITRASFPEEVVDLAVPPVDSPLLTTMEAVLVGVFSTLGVCCCLACCVRCYRKRSRGDYTHYFEENGQLDQNEQPRHERPRTWGMHTGRFVRSQNLLKNNTLNRILNRKLPKRSNDEDLSDSVNVSSASRVQKSPSDTEEHARKKYRQQGEGRPGGARYLVDVITGKRWRKHASESKPDPNPNGDDSAATLPSHAVPRESASSSGDSSSSSPSLKNREHGTRRATLFRPSLKRSRAVLPDTGDVSDYDDHTSSSRSDKAKKRHSRSTTRRSSLFWRRERHRGNDGVPLHERSDRELTSGDSLKVRRSGPNVTAHRARGREDGGNYKHAAARHDEAYDMDTVKIDIDRLKSAPMSSDSSSARPTSDDSDQKKYFAGFSDSPPSPLPAKAHDDRSPRSGHSSGLSPRDRSHHSPNTSGDSSRDRSHHSPNISGDSSHDRSHHSPNISGDSSRDRSHHSTTISGDSSRDKHSAVLERRHRSPSKSPVPRSRSPSSSPQPRSPRGSRSHSPRSHHRHRESSSPSGDNANDSPSVAAAGTVSSDKHSSSSSSSPSSSSSRSKHGDDRGAQSPKKREERGRESRRRRRTLPDGDSRSRSRSPSSSSLSSSSANYSPQQRKQRSHSHNNESSRGHPSSSSSLPSSSIPSSSLSSLSSSHHHHHAPRPRDRRSKRRSHISRARPHKHSPCDCDDVDTVSLSYVAHADHFDHGGHSHHVDHGDHSHHVDHGSHSHHVDHGVHSHHIDHGGHSHHVDHGGHSHHVDHGGHSHHVDHGGHSHHVDHGGHSHHVDHGVHSNHVDHGGHSHHDSKSGAHELVISTDDPAGVVPIGDDAIPHAPPACGHMPPPNADRRVVYRSPRVVIETWRALTQRKGGKRRTKSAEPKKKKVTLKLSRKRRSRSSRKKKKGRRRESEMSRRDLMRDEPDLPRNKRGLRVSFARRDLKRKKHRRHSRDEYDDDHSKYRRHSRDDYDDDHSDDRRHRRKHRSRSRSGSGSRSRSRSKSRSRSRSRSKNKSRPSSTSGGGRRSLTPAENMLESGDMSPPARRPPSQANNNEGMPDRKPSLSVKGDDLSERRFSATATSERDFKEEAEVSDDGAFNRNSRGHQPTSASSSRAQHHQPPREPLVPVDTNSSDVAPLPPAGTFGHSREKFLALSRSRAVSESSAIPTKISLPQSSSDGGSGSGGGSGGGSGSGGGGGSSGGGTRSSRGVGVGLGTVSIKAPPRHHRVRSSDYGTVRSKMSTVSTRPHSPLMRPGHERTASREIFHGMFSDASDTDYMASSPPARARPGSISSLGRSSQMRNPAHSIRSHGKTHVRSTSSPQVTLKRAAHGSPVAGQDVMRRGHTRAASSVLTNRSHREHVATRPGSHIQILSNSNVAGPASEIDEHKHSLTLSDRTHSHGDHLGDDDDGIKPSYERGNSNNTLSLFGGEGASSAKLDTDLLPYGDITDGRVSTAAPSPRSPRPRRVADVKSTFDAISPFSSDDNGSGGTMVKLSSTSFHPSAESLSVDSDAFNAFPFSPAGLRRPALIDHHRSFSSGDAANPNPNPSSDDTVKRFGRRVAQENQRRKRNERGRPGRVKLLRQQRRRHSLSDADVTMDTPSVPLGECNTPQLAPAGAEKDKVSPASRGSGNNTSAYPAPKRPLPSLPRQQQQQQRPRAHSFSEGSRESTLKDIEKRRALMVANADADTDAILDDILDADILDAVDSPKKKKNLPSRLFGMLPTPSMLRIGRSKKKKPPASASPSVSPAPSASPDPSASHLSPKKKRNSRIKLSLNKKTFTGEVDMVGDDILRQPAIGSPYGPRGDDSSPASTLNETRSTKSSGGKRRTAAHRPNIGRIFGRSSRPPTKARDRQPPPYESPPNKPTTSRRRPTPMGNAPPPHLRLRQLGASSRGVGGSPSVGGASRRTSMSSEARSMLDLRTPDDLSMAAAFAAEAAFDDPMPPLDLDRPRSPTGSTSPSPHHENDSTQSYSRPSHVSHISRNTRTSETGTQPHTRRSIFSTGSPTHSKVSTKTQKESSRSTAVDTGAGPSLNTTTHHTRNASFAQFIGDRKDDAAELESSGESCSEMTDTELFDVPSLRPMRSAEERDLVVDVDSPTVFLEHETRRGAPVALPPPRPNTPVEEPPPFSPVVAPATAAAVPVSDYSALPRVPSFSSLAQETPAGDSLVPEASSPRLLSDVNSVTMRMRSAPHSSDDNDSTPAVDADARATRNTPPLVTYQDVVDSSERKSAPSSNDWTHMTSDATERPLRVADFNEPSARKSPQLSDSIRRLQRTQIVPLPPPVPLPPTDEPNEDDLAAFTAPDMETVRLLPDGGEPESSPNGLEVRSSALCAVLPDGIEPEAQGLARILPDGIERTPPSSSSDVDQPSAPPYSSAGSGVDRDFDGEETKESRILPGTQLSVSSLSLSGHHLGAVGRHSAKGSPKRGFVSPASHSSQGSLFRESSVTTLSLEPSSFDEMSTSPRPTAAPSPIRLPPATPRSRSHSPAASRRSSTKSSRGLPKAELSPVYGPSSVDSSARGSGAPPPRSRSQSPAAAASRSRSSSVQRKGGDDKSSSESRSSSSSHFSDSRPSGLPRRQSLLSPSEAMIHTGHASPKLTGLGSTPEHEPTGRGSTPKHQRTGRGSPSSVEREHTGRDATGGGGMFGSRAPTDRDIELKTSYPDGLEKLKNASFIIEREKTPFDDTTIVDPMSRKPRRRLQRAPGIIPSEMKERDSEDVAMKVERERDHDKQRRRGSSRSSGAAIVNTKHASASRKSSNASDNPSNASNKSRKSSNASEKPLNASKKSRKSSNASDKPSSASTRKLSNASDKPSSATSKPRKSSNASDKPSKASSRKSSDASDKPSQARSRKSSNASDRPSNASSKSSNAPAKPVAATRRSSNASTKSSKATAKHVATTGKSSNARRKSSSASKKHVSGTNKPLSASKKSASATPLEATTKPSSLSGSPRHTHYEREQERRGDDKHRHRHTESPRPSKHDRQLEPDVDSASSSNSRSSAKSHAKSRSRSSSHHQEPDDHRRERERSFHEESQSARSRSTRHAHRGRDHEERSSPRGGGGRHHHDHRDRDEGRDSPRHHRDRRASRDRRHSESQRDRRHSDSQRERRHSDSQRNRRPSRDRRHSDSQRDEKARGHKKRRSSKHSHSHVEAIDEHLPQSARNLPPGWVRTTRQGKECFVNPETNDIMFFW